MPEENKKKDRLDLMFFITLVCVILFVALFNYIVDPYFIFRDSSIKGFNNVKTHKYTNKRTILYSDIKINNKRIDNAFVGNCLIARYGNGRDNVAFYTIPVSTVEEVSKIIKNIHKVAPHIKKMYWGLFFQDLWFDKNDEVTDTLPDIKSVKPGLDDYINLFFSWNTTKYSIETIRDSLKHHGKDIVYIYPYKEIAVKSYENCNTFENMEFIKDTMKFAKDNGIDLKIYYSPIHLTKRIHIYEKNAWNKNSEFKKRLADITPFYDYSFANEYNTAPLDANSVNFIDNIHPTDVFNNMIVEDLLSGNPKIGVLVTKDNVDKLVEQDTKQLADYIKQHKDFAEKIKKVSRDDAEIKILKSYKE